jgi:hypothetical protein
MTIRTIEIGNFWVATTKGEKFTIEYIGYGEYRVIRCRDKRSYLAESKLDAKHWIMYFS